MSCGAGCTSAKDFLPASLSELLALSTLWAPVHAAGLQWRTCASLNCWDGFRSGFFTGPEDMMGEGLSMEKVDCMHLMVPGRAFWLVSQCRSFSSASRLILSVDSLRLKPGASSSWMLLRHSSKVSGRAQEAADGGGTHLPFSLSSLSLMHLERALSDSTMRFWRRQSLQLRFLSRWPCLR